MRELRGSGAEEHVEFWDVDDIETLTSYKGKIRAIRAVVTKPGEDPSTWCFAIIGQRARQLGRRTALLIIRSRWHTLPPAQGPYCYHSAYRRGHASRSGPSSPAYSLVDSPARHQLTRRRTRANWAARTHRPSTSPHLRCGRGGSLTKTEPAVALTAPYALRIFRLSWPAHPGTPLRLEAELLGCSRSA